MKIKEVKIKKINVIQNEDVYDISVRDNYNFFANDLLVHNCAELCLSSYDSCRLMVLNLISYVENYFTEKAKFNYILFAKHIQIAQRLMDDLVDLELEQIDKILKKIKNDPENHETKRVETELWNKIKQNAINGRRTGLGLTSLGDALAYLNIKYSSDESIKEVNEIYKTLVLNTYKSSINLAKERGTFPIFNLELEKDHSFLTKLWLADKELYEDYKKYGRRNIACNTQSPTGTVSLMTQTSSGIEPIFMLEYKRRKKIMNVEIKPDFIDQNGDKWQEYVVYHHGLKKWMEITGETDITKSPYYKATANEIDFLKGIDIQSTAQHWIDHSISKTVNLKSDVTKETVSDLYMKAWELGCKGFTVYREGSRSGVLIKKEEEFKINHAPKRPKVLEADYYVATVKGVKFAVIVGLWPGTNRPWEVFAFENPPMEKNTKGKTIKVKKGEYKFVNGEFEISDLNLAMSRVEEKTLTLSASMILRHGAPVKYVNHVISKIDENVTSFSSALRRTLSRYIDDELTLEKCPECGSSMVQEENCRHCSQCTFSKCG